MYATALRALGPALLLLGVLGGCATPAADKYVAGGGAAAAPPIDLGHDTAGEACQGHASEGGETLVYCGTWEQPSGRVTEGAPAAADAAMALAADSPWRAGLERRLECHQPSRTVILGDVPAATVPCERKLGGWPEVALVAVYHGRAWFADGVQPAFPALQRAVGVASGRLSAAEAPRATAQGLEAARLAAASYSAHDIGTYETLLQRAARANLEEDYADAEKAYRAAAAILDKQRAGNPDAATALMAEALQVSDEGRMVEADALFDRAGALVRSPGLHDRTAAARLLHYRGIALLNEGRPEPALVLFRRAQGAYRALLPAEIVRGGLAAERAGTFGGLDEQLMADAVLRDPEVDGALLGLIEVRRYEAVALKQLGRGPEAEMALQDADAMSRSSGFGVPALRARLLRTSGAIAALSGRRDAAFTAFSGSVTSFEQSLPGSRPVAVTDLLRAASLEQAGRAAEAAVPCREAVAILRTRGNGIAAGLMGPCLDAFVGLAASARAGAQGLLAEAFEAGQLTQGGLTSQEIAEAAAQLQENARDPKVAAAFRDARDARDALDELQRQRDALATAPTGASDARVPALDAKITAAREKLREADEAVQASAPNLPQLVQQVVPARDVLHALEPGEVFVSVVLDRDQGWTFALRDGRISVARVEQGSAAIDKLVARIRASVLPGADGTPPPFDTAAARELYDRLFGALAAEMNHASGLVVAPSGSLLSIPFSVLLTGPADPAALDKAPFLVRQISIAHVPSAANFVALRAAAGGSRAPLPWFGFGDFRPVTLAQAERSFPTAACADSARLLAGLPLLDSFRAQLETARSLLHASADAELLGAAFTADAVLNLPLSQYRILHFATHAILPTDLRCQDQQALVTSAPAGAPDAAGAFLTAAEVQGLHLDADAVILSACNTAGPGGKAGESLSGLARSFLYAGARAVVVSHWDVNAAFGTLVIALALDFYADGKGFPSALAAAERKVLERSAEIPAQAHPYYWAPFAVIGADRARIGS